MKEQKNGWADSLLKRKNEDGLILGSKSEIKRNLNALRQVAVELVKLSKHGLQQVPLDEVIFNAILLAQKIKKEGWRRQIQLITKLLRTADLAAIQAALDKLNNRHNQQINELHRLEALRDKLMIEGDVAIAAVITCYPKADRQQLRALVRNAQKEQLSKKETDDTQSKNNIESHSVYLQKPVKALRQIFQYLRQLADEKNYS